MVDGDLKNSEFCCVCQETTTDSKEDLIVLACGHNLHVGCLNSFVEFRENESSSVAQCPLCRRPLNDVVHTFRKRKKVFGKGNVKVNSSSSGTWRKKCSFREGGFFSNVFNGFLVLDDSGSDVSATSPSTKSKTRKRKSR